MCGRYYISESDQAEIQKILRKIDAQNQAGKYRTGEVFPTNIAPVITNDEKLKLFSWGFPKWQAKGVIINARSETAATKPTFSKALRERRCAIPSSGFFEWQKIDASKPKTKYLFTSDEEPVMYFAGIWSEYKGEDTGKFVILTRRANISIADIHDRMPVVLYEREIDSWLNDEQFVDFVLNRDNIVLNRKEVGADSLMR